MTYLVSIATDSLVICEGKVMEARTSMEAVLAALHHETSAYKHLRDLPMARLRIRSEPKAVVLCQRDLTLNQEGGSL